MPSAERFKALGAISYRLIAAHCLIQDSTNDLSNDEMKQSGGLTVPSIVFHLWHIARRTDRVQSLIAESKEMSEAQELWTVEGWWLNGGLAGTGLGEAEAAW